MREKFRYGQYMLICLVLSVIMWCLVEGADVRPFLVETIIVAIGVTALTIIFLFMQIFSIWWKGKSPFVMFGIIDSALLLVLAAYGVYDVIFDKGILPGILGFIILCFPVPVLGGLLIIDLIWGLIRRHKNKRNKSNV